MTAALSTSRNPQTLRRLRAEAVLRGDCITCRCRPAKPGKKTCETCLAKNYASEKRIAERRRRQRRCPDCGAKPARGMVRCDRCNAADARRARARVAAGKCSCCSAMADAGRRMCGLCSAKNADRVAGIRRALIAAGICSVAGCGARLESEWFCFGHLMRMRRASRDRRAQEARAA